MATIVEMLNRNSRAALNAGGERMLVSWIQIVV
jgi:hypothetical protein